VIFDEILCTQNPELVRLTGKHPFNSEARLGVLFECVGILFPTTCTGLRASLQGFLTPAHLHFVRNHGAVPQVNRDMAANWTIRIHGLVEREVTFTLQELQEKFPVVTLPITLVCAGNRRKEQNVVRKTLGFSWGAAGGEVSARADWKFSPTSTSSINSPLDGRVSSRCVESRKTNS
jgi:nitrate reductase (NAD(P)H)